VVALVGYIISRKGHGGSWGYRGHAKGAEALMGYIISRKGRGGSWGYRGHAKGAEALMGYIIARKENAKALGVIEVTQRARRLLWVI